MLNFKKKNYFKFNQLNTIIKKNNLNFLKQSDKVFPRIVINYIYIYIIYNTVLPSVEIELVK